MAPRNNRRPRPGTEGNANPVEDKALIEVSKQALEQLKALQSLNLYTKETLNTLGRIETQLNDPSTGGGGGRGSGGGGGYAPGPNGGRPTMPGDQTRRPSMGPGGGYPGYPGAQPGMPGNPFGGFGGNMGGMGGVFGAAQAGAARLMQNMGGFGASPPGAPPAVRYEQQADGSYISFGANGRPVERDISPATYQRRMEVSQAAARMGGSSGAIGAIRGAISGLPTGAKVAGGIVGGGLISLEAGQRFGQFVGDQRAANAQYESIYGPGTSGFDQRRENFAGRFRNTASNIGSALGLSEGGLTDGDYDKAFKSISAMGYQGTDRDSMIGFAKGNFNTMGMSVDESLKLIGINAKETASSLTSLHTSLKQVSEMAQQTGQSAEVLRQSFTQSYATSVGAGFASSSSALAQAQVASTAGQGRRFAGLDTSSMYGSVGARQVLANRAGYGSVLDFTLASQANPQVAAQAQQTQLNQLFESVVPSQVRAAIEAAIAKHGGAQNVATNPNAAQQVVHDVEQQSPGSMNSIAILSALRTAGISGVENMNEVDAATYYVQWVAKNGQNFTASVAKSVAANSQKVGTTQAQLGNALNRLDTGGGAFGKTDIAYTTVGGTTVKNFFGSGKGTLTKGGTAVYDPIIEQLRQNGIERVTVQTKDGPLLVSLDDAAKNYRDQLTKGTALIASGPKSGQSVGTAFGTEVNAKGPDTTSSAAKGGIFDSSVQKAITGLQLTDDQISGLALTKKFFGVSDQTLIKQAHKAANGGGGGGTITVGLKPEVAKYLDISTTGDSLVNQGAASNTPPPIPTSGSSTGH